MAGLSLVMPDSWITGWHAGKPWEQAPDITMLESDVE